jgi:hypothetical protein
MQTYYGPADMMHEAMIRLFSTDPVAIVITALCLFTIALAVRLLRRFHNPLIRYLLGILGLLCIHNSFQMFYDKLGLTSLKMTSLDDLVNLAVIGLCMGALFTLGLLSREHNRTRFQLRLSEAEEQSPAAVMRGKPATSPG